MAKTTVDSIVAKIKRRFDYSITDTDLDTLVIDTINDTLKQLKQFLYNNGLFEDISKQATFKTVALQPYVDITNPFIAGNVTTFTGIAADTVTVTIDGTAFAGISLATATSIGDVISAINAAAGFTGTASQTNGYLIITSPTSLSTSNVTIANGVGTAATRLFQNVATLTGNSTTFTPVALDSLVIHIDGTEYTQLMAGLTTIDLIVTAINTTVGSTVASKTSEGYLKITGSSVVTVRNGAGTPRARLFAAESSITQASITDLDEILALSERTYKFTLLNMPYEDFIAMYPDPDSIRAVVPDVYARWYNRIYFGPTPNATSLLYMDYIFDVTEVASGGTLPYDNEYDPLIIAMCKLELMEWLDSTNTTGIATAKAKVKELKDNLIDLAAKNVKMNRQTASRRNVIPYFSPRKKIVA